MGSKRLDVVLLYKMNEKRYWELFHKNGDKEIPDPKKEEAIYLDMFQRLEMNLIFLSVIADKLGIDKKQLYDRALEMVRGQ